MLSEKRRKNIQTQRESDQRETQKKEAAIFGI